MTSKPAMLYEIQVLARRMRANGFLRYGQSLMNAAQELCPLVYSDIQFFAPECDCFFDDSRVHAFEEFVEAYDRFGPDWIRKQNSSVTSQSTGPLPVAVDPAAHDIHSWIPQMLTSCNTPDAAKILGLYLEWKRLASKELEQKI